MRRIPPRLREQIARDPFMRHCIYKGCIGKPEWEHAIIIAGVQLNEAWAIVPVCTYHHRGAGLDKRYNEYAALCRATPEELAKYPRTGLEQKKKYLSKTYGAEQTKLLSARATRTRNI